MCQLDSLEHCFSPEMLREALKSLPETLDKTYDRILDSINPAHGRMALRLLQWLVFSAQPMTLEEIGEIIAIDIEKTPRFDPDRRFQEPRDILRVCSSLVSLVSQSDGAYSQQEFMAFDSSPSAENDNRNSAARSEVRLSHYSVKEYLMSDRIRHGSAMRYSIREIDANRSIAKTCLAYLLHFGNVTGPLDNVHELDPWRFIYNFAYQDEYPTFKEFPFLEYVGKHWVSHARVFEEHTNDTSPLAIELVETNNDALAQWFCLNELFQSRVWDIDWMSLKSKKRYSLIEASRLGLPNLVKALLDSRADVDAFDGKAENILLVDALLFASYDGYHRVVQVLLNHRIIDFDIHYGRRRSALVAASRNGHVEVAQLLLAHEDYVGAHGAFLADALTAAAGEGHKEIVKLLLGRRADIIAQSKDPWILSALREAAIEGQEEVFELLLNEGAIFNSQHDEDFDILQSAVRWERSEELVQLILDQGANINAQSGKFGTALQAATTSAFDNSETLVQLLLNRGADVNAQGGYYNTALQAAAASTYSYTEKTVQLLLNHGANVDTQGGHYGTALQAAACQGRKCLVLQLMTQNDEFQHVQEDGENLLEVLLSRYKIMQLLLENGANTYVEGLCADTMQDAIKSNPTKALRLLLAVAEGNVADHISDNNESLEPRKYNSITDDDILAYWEKNESNWFRGVLDGTKPSNNFYWSD